MPGFVLLMAVALAASLLSDRRKTWLGVQRGLRMFARMLPTLAGVLAGVSLALAAVPPESLRALLGRDSPVTFILALVIGSVTLMPAFVAYPLAAGLKAAGASVPVLAAFITTLMMVGVVTLPVEARALGWRVALWRNGLSFVGAVVVAACMSLILR
jgi:uncharacterized membrane protein YraQ (UPF0718 family)